MFKSGYRVEKKINAGITRYPYNGDKVVLETGGNNIQTAFQLYGTNLLYRAVSTNSSVGSQEYYYMYNARS